MKHTILPLILALLLPAPLSLAESPAKKLIEQAKDNRNLPRPAEFAYGKDPLQKLDYWKPEEKGAPLVVFVHGGGWKRGDKRHAADPKAAHYTSQGYAFASLNYRLVPENTVEEQAGDIADALAYLIKSARSLGFDKDRIVLMGHSAGAHLSALVGTDTRILGKAGLRRDAIKGIIPLDGACYDVPRQMDLGAGVMKETYLQAFGDEEKRQLELSPVHHAAAPNAPAFLILHVQRIDGTIQSKALHAGLQEAGTPSEIHGIQGFGLKGHAEINRRLGDPAYPATPIVDSWLKQIFLR